MVPLQNFGCACTYPGLTQSLTLYQFKASLSFYIMYWIIHRNVLPLYRLHIYQFETLGLPGAFELLKLLLVKFPTPGTIKTKFVLMSTFNSTVVLFTHKTVFV